MTDRVRCVNGNRSFAWLEFEDTRDGTAFVFGLQGMGWKNLLLDLRATTDDDGAPVLADDNRDLQVRVFEATARHERGALWIPGDADGFTEQWIRKPGVIASPQQTLVFGDEPGARWADLVVVSGHGSKGKVYGVAYSRLTREDGAQERTWNVAGMLRDRTTPRGTRLKYLILACCTNAGIAIGPMWLPAFEDRPPEQVLHGILGYAQMYPGDEVGAGIMRRFVDLLFPEKVNGRPPESERTILQCWAEANRGAAAWGAVMIEDAARHDRMSQWVSEQGLSDPATITVKQYDEFTTDFPRPLDDSHGIVLTSAPPEYEARFWVSKRGDAQTNLQLVDGAAFGWDGHDTVQVGNNDNFVDPQLGLDPGRAGKLVLSSRSGSFAPGTTMTVVFYLYRETHEDLDLRALLDLQLSPSQRRRCLSLVDANQRKPDTGKGHVDALQYTFDDADEEARFELAHGRAELLFVVPPDAPERNHDRGTARSCGYFWVDVVPPRKIADPRRSPPEDMPPRRLQRSDVASYLRRAVHLVRHGVYLHLHHDDPAREQADQDEAPAALAELRGAYDAEIGAGVA
jgi:hypothetical protein